MKITTTLILLLTCVSCICHAQKLKQKQGIINFEQTITLNFDSSKNDDILLQLVSGHKATINYKIIFADSISKKYHASDSTSYLNNTYAFDNESDETFVFIRELNKNKEVAYTVSKNKKAHKSTESKYSNLEYKFTGKTKKIIGFNCKEIEFFENADGRKIKISAYLTDELPISAGYIIYSNLSGAIVEMHAKNSDLIPVSFRNATNKIELTNFLP